MSESDRGGFEFFVELDLDNPEQSQIVPGDELDSVAGEATECCPCSGRHDDTCEKHPGPVQGERRRILGLLEAARDAGTADQAFYLGKIIEAVRRGDRAQEQVVSDVELAQGAGVYVVEGDR